MKKNVLLLGAGFSRNWGGWLAAEALEYLLGCAEINPPVRRILLKHRNAGGFEAALAELQDGNNRLARSAPSTLLRFQDAIAQMFSDMDAGFSEVEFEFNNAIKYQVSTFLTRFDAIFTLNQDRLLERHYLNENVSLLSNGRWDGWCIPGMVLQGTPDYLVNSPSLGLWVPADPGSFAVPKRLQPYFKLHGSSNWYASPDQSVMVIGGNKQAFIDRHPILKYNFEQFWRVLHEKNTRLMVIGYSFRDEHVNRVLQSSVESTDLGIFVVDPSGIDVINVNRHGRAENRTTFAETLLDRVIGASRRPLSSTFHDDRVEHAKVMRFFE